MRCRGEGLRRGSGGEEVGVAGVAMVTAGADVTQSAPPPGLGMLAGNGSGGPEDQDRGWGRATDAGPRGEAPAARRTCRGTPNPNVNNDCAPRELGRLVDGGEGAVGGSVRDWAGPHAWPPPLTVTAAREVHAPLRAWSEPPPKPPSAEQESGVQHRPGSRAGGAWAHRRGIGLAPPETTSSSQVSAPKLPLLSPSRQPPCPFAQLLHTWVSGLAWCQHSNVRARQAWGLHLSWPCGSRSRSLLETGYRG